MVIIEFTPPTYAKRVYLSSLKHSMFIVSLDGTKQPCPVIGLASEIYVSSFMVITCSNLTDTGLLWYTAFICIPPRKYKKCFPSLAMLTSLRS